MLVSVRKCVGRCKSGYGPSGCMNGFEDECMDEEVYGGECNVM